MVGSVNVPRTVDTRCQTPGCGCTLSSSSTRTLPGRQTRDRSLRIRSMIMMFSAASLADARSRPRHRLRLRGAVPLIGAVKASRPRTRRNSSGLNDGHHPAAGHPAPVPRTPARAGQPSREEHRCGAVGTGVQPNAEVHLVEVTPVDPRRSPPRPRPGSRAGSISPARRVDERPLDQLIRVGRIRRSPPRASPASRPGPRRRRPPDPATRGTRTTSRRPVRQRSTES